MRRLMAATHVQKEIFEIFEIFEMFLVLRHLPVHE